MENLSNEIWKDVPGFEGFYTVSNLGRLYSFRRKKIMKPNKTKKGYLRTSLTINGLTKSLLVHRIVATAFISNTEEKSDVNHINGIKDDNKVSNLEWCSSSENSIHAINLGLKTMRKGEYHGRSKLTEKDVLEIRRIGKTMTQKEIAKKFGIVHSQVGFILRRIQWKHI